MYHERSTVCKDGQPKAGIHTVRPIFVKHEEKKGKNEKKDEKKREKGRETGLVEVPLPVPMLLLLAPPDHVEHNLDLTKR